MVAMTPCLLGLDLGTTTVTAALVDAERGRLLHRVQRRNDSALQSAPSTRAEQDPHRLRILALDLLSELAARGPVPEGIALTGQKHGLLCVDADGQPLSPLISWQDRRTAEPLPGGSTTLDRLHARLTGLSPRPPLAENWQENGCRIAHGYGAATLFWLIRQGELPPATQSVCTIAGWLAAQLVGRPPVTDPTLAASWGLYSLVDGAWNADFLERLGLERRFLPPVLPSGEPLGGLEAGVARQVGLPSGIPILNAVGDTQASFLGSVPDPEGTLLFNLGTGGQICWMVPRFEVPSERVETRPLPCGRYMRVGASLCGGAAYAWLNRTVRAWLAEFGLETGEEDVYRQLGTLAAACEDTAGLRVRPTFLGVRGDPSIQGGAIEGITPGNLRLGVLARATLIGVVDELRRLYLDHAGETARFASVAATGGGVVENPLLPGLIEERFGLPVCIPPQRETAVLGAAQWAAHRLTPGART
jgi:sedoheptulokinase